MLSAALAAIVLAGIAAGVGREIGRSLRFALPFALLITLINPLVYPEGDTLLFRGGEVLGRRIDITLEATVAGALNGMRVIVIVDGVRPAVRRGGPGPAAADVPARVVPLGAHRDAGHAPRAGAGSRRHAHGRRRALPPASARPADRGAGGAVGRARPRRGRGGRARGARLLARRAHGSPAAGRGRATTGAWAARPLVIAVAAVAGAIAGLGTVEAYPTLQIETGPPELALSAGVVLLALAPFAGRAARMGVAHA